MAGRLDESALKIAMLEASKASEHASAILQHLNQILESRSFRNSHRSQEFLRYVVVQTLMGHGDQLKERILGIELFNRDADYDTNTDAIVRVTAADVRKRLLDYYTREGSATMQISLPAGTYLPAFRGQEQAQNASSSTALQLDQPAGESAINGRETTAQGQAASLLKSLPRAIGSKRLRVTLALLWTLLAFAAGWLTRTALFAPGDPTHSGRDLATYRDLIGPMLTAHKTATEIVLSNPRVYLYLGSNNPNQYPNVPGISVALDSKLADQLAPGANDVQAKFQYRSLQLDTNDYTGMGEAKAAFEVGDLFQLFGQSTRLTEARFLNWEDARSNNLVMLGAPLMNTWIQNGLPQADFEMQHDQILNHHPQSGEQKVYTRALSNSGATDYGLIWMTKTPSGTQILVLAGMTSTGTAGVGEYFANPVKMRTVYNQLKQTSKSGKIPENWQVLLRIISKDDIPLQVIPLAFHAE
jgi:hypothetical protein